MKVVAKIRRPPSEPGDTVKRSTSPRMSPAVELPSQTKMRRPVESDEGGHANMVPSSSAHPSSLSAS